MTTKEYNKRKYQNTMLGVFCLGLMFSIFTTPYVWKKVNIKDVVKPVEIKAVEIVPTATPTKIETPFCYDPITCIRDVGEELGESNSDIMTMIKIAKAESGYRTDAINKNKNGTFDIGVFQINDVHSKRISRQDRMDFEKNIRFAYKLHQEQKHSFTAWSVWNKGLIK